MNLNSNIKLPSPTNKIGIFLSRLMERPNEWVEFDGPGRRLMYSYTEQLRVAYGFDVRTHSLDTERTEYRIKSTHIPDFVMYVKNSTEPLLDTRCKEVFDALVANHGQWTSLKQFTPLPVRLRRLRHKYHVEVELRNSCAFKLVGERQPYFEEYVALVKRLFPE